MKIYLFAVIFLQDLHDLFIETPMKVESSVTLNEMEFSPALDDPESTEYQELKRTFEAEVYNFLLFYLDVDIIE